MDTATPTMITVFKERADHNAECARCSTAGQTGRGCDKGADFYSRISQHVARRETPYVVRRTKTYGTGYTEVRNKGCWTEREASAEASVHGGEVIDQTHLYVVA